MKKSTKNTPAVLRKIQGKHRREMRLLSKIMHNPVVDAISDVLASTIARPYGLLWGGILSTAATLLTLFICNFYGYEYNHLVGICAFFVGFVLGLAIELMMSLLKRTD